MVKHSAFLEGEVKRRSDVHTVGVQVNGHKWEEKNVVWSAVRVNER